MTTAGSGQSDRTWSNPYIAGVLLGVVLFVAYFVTSHGLGASGGIQRFLAWAIDLVDPEHVDATPALAEYAGGDVNPLDSYIIPMVVGIPAGGFISALLSGRLRAITGRGPNVSKTQRWVFAAIGGLIMGFGARMARGCTSGLALSGGATLSVGAWAFMIAFFGGGYLAAHFVRKLWN